MAARASLPPAPVPAPRWGLRLGLCALVVAAVYGL